MMIVPTDLASLAKLILSQECQHIGVLTGAGVSVASGIPDFRSPGGMYSTLKPELITATKEQRQAMKDDPTNVVSWQMFQQNQFPYLEVRRPFILGSQEQRWKATIAHRFFELLYVKTSKLTRVYTQNIDGLDFQCCPQLPAEKIVPVHGTIKSACCEGCGTDMDYDEFCDKVRTQIKDIYYYYSTTITTTTHDDDDDNDNNNNNNDDDDDDDRKDDDNENDDDKESTTPPPTSSDSPSESTPILCEHCHLPLVKPNTVLFGRNLAWEFFELVAKDIPKLDLLIVAGTSLVVSPANALVQAVRDDTIRVIVNRDRVGQELGIRYNNDNNNAAANCRDYFAQGDCDDIFLALTQELGWLDDLVIYKLPPTSAEKVEKARQDTAYTKWF